MKLHASVGADILSSIDFPTGRADRPTPSRELTARGHPTASRAPRSDWRADSVGRRLLRRADPTARTDRSSDDEAENIDRTPGKHNDPQVVDTFIKVYKQIARAASARCRKMR
jgi:hypothetical protein